MKHPMGPAVRRPAAVLLAGALAWVGMQGVSHSASLGDMVPPARPTRTATPDRPRLLQEACRSDNPAYATTRMARWGIRPDAPAIVVANDSASAVYEPEHPGLFDLASQADFGAVYGLAYDAPHRQLYASAFYGMDLAFGRGGPGGIYRIDLNTSRRGLVASLPAGPDRHRFGAPYFDVEVMPLLGRAALGDIDVDTADSLLFVANLYDQRIYALSIPEMTVVGSFEGGASATGWAANARLFGLGFRDGWLYHGVVDSRQDPALPGDLAAYVYRSRPDGTAMAEVLRIDLTYPRHPPWVPWNDVTSWDPFPATSQPIVADIEFRPNGDPVVGLANRHIWQAWGTMEGGDVLATVSVAPGRWRRAAEADFYADDIVVNTRPPRPVDEPLYGNLARVPRRDGVVTVAAGPAMIGGLQWYSSASGQVQGPADGFEPLFGDVYPAIGDIESLCPATADPTPSPSPPTPVRSPTPTPSPRPTPSTTATPPPRRPIYLPATLRHSCRGSGFSDVVLVVDDSTSMERRGPDGIPKIEAALMAVEGFVDLLDPAPGDAGPGDRVAIVGFNSRAWAVKEFEDRAGPVGTALWLLRVQVAEGTRLDLALGEAAALV
ncbi:MAG: vWA domain-containing protein, partial [Anaerolineae bacterium]